MAKNPQYKYQPQAAVTKTAASVVQPVANVSSEIWAVTAVGPLGFHLSSLLFFPYREHVTISPESLTADEKVKLKHAAEHRLVALEIVGR
jgi:hypothetical protein